MLNSHKLFLLLKKLTGWGLRTCTPEASLYVRNSGGGQGTLMTSILRPRASVALVRRSYASVDRSYCAASRPLLC